MILTSYKLAIHFITLQITVINFSRDDKFQVQQHIKWKQCMSTAQQRDAQNQTLTKYNDS